MSFVMYVYIPENKFFDEYGNIPLESVALLLKLNKDNPEAIEFIANQLEN